MKSKILWITRTAVFVALLLTFQATTAAAGQYITGSLVNLVLVTAALTSGVWTGVTVALVSPFAAFLLGIGPQIIQIVPFIALGNIVIVVVVFFAAGKFTAQKSLKSWIFMVVGVVLAAVLKFATLYFGVVKVFISLMGEGLNEKQVANFSTMFSFPQLVTALIGGLLAIPIAKTVSRILKTQK